MKIPNQYKTLSLHLQDQENKLECRLEGPKPELEEKRLILNGYFNSDFINVTYNP